MRLFVGVPLPAAVRDRVAARVERLRDRFPRASWVRAGNLHLTLAFLGELDPDRSAQLEASLRGALSGRAGIRARTGAAGAFPPRGPLRVIWLGLEPATSLVELAAAARRGLAEARLELAESEFHPHVTLARARAPWPARWREELGQLECGEMAFEIRSVALIESELAPGGSIYRARAEFALGEAA